MNGSISRGLAPVYQVALICKSVIWHRLCHVSSALNHIFVQMIPRNLRNGKSLILKLGLQGARFGHKGLEGVESPVYKEES